MSVDSVLESDSSVAVDYRCTSRGCTAYLPVQDDHCGWVSKLGSVKDMDIGYSCLCESSTLHVSRQTTGGCKRHKVQESEIETHGGRQKSIERLIPVSFRSLIDG